MTSLIDIYIAEQKLKIIAEKYGILKLTTVWKGRYILMTYNKATKMIDPIEWIITNDIDEKEYGELTKIIQKCIRNT